jgi:predicted aspartyl protease
MPAPKRPNTAAATATVRRRGDETAAVRLRDHGWLVIPPEVVAELPAEIVERVNNVLAAVVRTPGDVHAVDL